MQKVYLDPLVALRIEKHARGNSTVTGALLGLAQNDILITNCFRHPTLKDDESDDDFQLQMMKCLRAVNGDCNMVGWYHSSTASSFLNQSWLQLLYDYHVAIPNSIVLEYDPFDSLTGILSLRAYRLTDSYVELVKSKSQKQISGDIMCGNLVESGILVELPVFIKTNPLVSALVNDLNLNVIAPVLLSKEEFVEKNITALLETLDSFTMECSRHHNWQRLKTKAESLNSKKTYDSPEDAEMAQKSILAKLPAEPSKVDSMLLCQQVLSHYKQISSFLHPSSLLFAFNGIKE